MKLEYQVISLEIAKKLKKLDIIQNSLWYWCQYADKRTKAFLITNEQRYENPGIYESYYSAFTCAELGELLPWGYISCKLYNTAGKCEFLGWGCQEIEDEKDSKPYSTEANARGSMLIYLLENNLINKDNPIDIADEHEPDDFVGLGDMEDHCGDA